MRRRHACRLGGRPAAPDRPRVGCAELECRHSPAAARTQPRCNAVDACRQCKIGWRNACAPGMARFWLGCTHRPRSQLNWSTPPLPRRQQATHGSGQTTQDSVMLACQCSILFHFKRAIRTHCWSARRQGLAEGREPARGWHCHVGIWHGRVRGQCPRQDPNSTTREGARGVAHEV